MSVRLSSSLLLIFLAFSHSIVAQTTLTVAAASDLSALQPELLASFHKNRPTVNLRFVSGASGMLAQQIENGAPFDVFLSANSSFVDQLTKHGRIDSKEVVVYASGRVGVLWRDGKEHELRDLASDRVRSVALPNPKLAPYGVAAQQALEHAGVWEVVRAKLVYAENVRQTLQLFESGNVDAVLTAASLLQGKKGQLIPADWHQPVLQKAGVVQSTSNRAAAGEFLHFLATPAARAVFARYSLDPPPASSTPGSAPSLAR